MKVHLEGEKKPSLAQAGNPLRLSLPVHFHNKGGTHAYHDAHRSLEIELGVHSRSLRHLLLRHLPPEAGVRGRPQGRHQHVAQGSRHHHVCGNMPLQGVLTGVRATHRRSSDQSTVMREVTMFCPPTFHAKTLNFSDEILDDPNQLCACGNCVKLRECIVSWTRKEGSEEYGWHCLCNAACFTARITQGHTA